MIRLAALCSLALLAGCRADAPVETGRAKADAAPPAVSIANPASTHCAQLKGKLQIVTDGAGNQSAYCNLPDGRVCEEWALFRDKMCVPPKS